MINSCCGFETKAASLAEFMQSCSACPSLIFVDGIQCSQVFLVECCWISRLVCWIETTIVCLYAHAIQCHVLHVLTPIICFFRTVLRVTHAQKVPLTFKHVQNHRSLPKWSLHRQRSHCQRHANLCCGWHDHCKWLVWGFGAAFV